MESSTKQVPPNQTGETSTSEFISSQKENPNLTKIRNFENSSNSEVVKSGPSQGRVLLKLLVHSLAMFSIPFATYYLIRNYAEKEYDIGSPRSYIYGAIGAVIVVQFIIGSYIYQAFKEEEFSKPPKKKLS